MANTPRNLLVDSTSQGPLGRCLATETCEKQFAASSGAAGVIGPLTPISKNSATGLHVAAVNGGANSTSVIVGFAYDFAHNAAGQGVPVNASGGGESTGIVMVAGEIDARDIPFATFGTQAQLFAQLRTNIPSLRELNITVRGLEGVP